MSHYIPYEQATGERAEETFSTLDAAEHWILANVDDTWNWAVEETAP